MLVDCKVLLHLGRGRTSYYDIQGFLGCDIILFFKYRHELWEQLGEIMSDGFV